MPPQNSRQFGATDILARELVCRPVQHNCYRTELLQTTVAEQAASVSRLEDETRSQKNRIAMHEANLDAALEEVSSSFE